MQKISQEQVRNLLAQFKEGYDVVEKDGVWSNLSNKFRSFWNDRVMTAGEQIEDSEIDPIIRILDWNAKGHSGHREAVARAMIAQGAWRRMFNELHDNKELSNSLNKIFIARSDEDGARAIDELYKFNESKKNNLTGPSGNAVNSMLVAYDPVSNVSMISMGDRLKFLNAIEVEIPAKFEDESQGFRMIQSQKLIITYFRKLGSIDSARTLSVFMYSPLMKSLWKVADKEENVEEEVDETEEAEQKIVTKNKSADSNTFYIERQLEDFLVENWENTEFGKKLELIQEGDKFSQQYPTKIGKIDILAKVKKTGQYVVIELKKGKTSDDVVGQIARYMGWIGEHKSKDVRGIIVTSETDERLYYALKQIKNVELWVYKVDFHLDKIQSSGE